MFLSSAFECLYTQKVHIITLQNQSGKIELRIYNQEYIAYALNMGYYHAAHNTQHDDVVYYAVDKLNDDTIIDINPRLSATQKTYTIVRSTKERIKHFKHDKLTLSEKYSSVEIRSKRVILEICYNIFKDYYVFIYGDVFELIMNKLPDYLRNDRDIARALVQLHLCNLKYTSEEIQNDKDFIVDLIKHDGLELRYTRFKNDDSIHLKFGGDYD